MNEIQQWLAGERNYEQGVALANRYLRNQSLLRYFSRHYDPKKLVYQLNKIKGLRDLQVTQKQRYVVPMPYDQAAVEKERKLIVFDDHIHVDDLPDHLKPLYLQNRELYKLMRALHEKMKLAKTDEERAKFRKSIEEYDEVIAENWKTLDAWDGTVDTPSADPVELTEEEKEKQLAAARKFVSVNVKKALASQGLTRQQLAFKVAERVNILVNAGVQIGESMKLHLKMLGIDC